VTRDYGELALFQLTNFNAADMGQVLYNGEMFAFTLLGIVCGLMGAVLNYPRTASPSSPPRPTHSSRGSMPLRLHPCASALYRCPLSLRGCFSAPAPCILDCCSIASPIYCVLDLLGFRACDLVARAIHP